MLIDALVFCNEARRLGFDDIEVSLSMRGYSFGKIQYGIVADFYSKKLSELINSNIADIFNPQLKPKEFTREERDLLHKHHYINGSTIVKTRNFYEFDLFVEECRGAIKPFCVKVEIIKPELTADEKYPESIEIKRIKEKSEEEKEYARIEGYQKCEKRYSDRFYEIRDRVDNLEEKIKNPKFYERVKRMNPNGVLIGNEKGKELIKVISEIDVIKRHIRELTKST
jgi:hypothetical protein